MSKGLKSLATEIFSAAVCKNAQGQMRFSPLGQDLHDNMVDFVIAVPDFNQRLAMAGEKQTDAAYKRAFDRKENGAIRLARSFVEVLPYLEAHTPQLAEDVKDTLADIGFRYVAPKQECEEDAEDLGGDEVTGDVGFSLPSPKSESDMAALSPGANLR
ncbi:MAG: hypothetical protein AB7E85_01810 [Pseudobdellovibrionaceae bacterium]